MPWALTPEGGVIGPEQASRGIDFLCPQCREKLLLRGGTPRVRRHFYHRPGSSCSYETILHLAAKEALRNILSLWLKGEVKAPRVLTICSGSDLWRCDCLKESPLKRERVDQVAVEYTLECGLRPDLVLMSCGQPVLALEVKVTHAVGPQKGAVMGVPWLEMEAEAVVRAPGWWCPINQNLPARRTEWRCGFCHSAGPRHVEQVLRGVLEDPHAVRSARDAERLFKKAFQQRLDELRAKWAAKHTARPPWVVLREPDYRQMADLCQAATTQRWTVEQRAQWRKALEILPIGEGSGGSSGLK